MKILNLDINSKNTKIGQLEKCDTARLLCTLEDKDYSNSIIRILGKKADKTFVEQIIEVQDNTIDCILNEQFTTCEGITRVEINIVSEGNEWTSNENYFYVSNTLNAEIIESADNLETLEKVDKYVASAISDLKEFEVIKDDLTVVNETMKKDEENRRTNEIIRGNSEILRESSEKERVVNEEERVANELERVQAEADRKINENNRKLAETLRNTAETTRATAELQRQDTFEYNEDIRNENEKTRIAAEIKRENSDKKHNANESNRSINEVARVNSEKSRVQEELTRKTKENSRIEAEVIRQETYTNFNNAEVTRKENELSRVNSEEIRIVAESTRQATFGKNETDRATTFTSNEASRSNTFNSNESTRKNEFESNETVRMNKFNEVEKAREVIFEKSESTRNATFIAKENTREENEVTRKNNENLRVTAETKRVDVEKTRVSNEVARVNSETLRKSAEVNRVNAEANRVVAEENREEKVTEIKDSQHKISTELSEITQEIREARSDYFGKEYPNLKAKEDAEFEFVNIDNSKGMYMPTSSNTGAIKVENSIEGKTKDLKVNGRTLQNIISNSKINYVLNSVKVDNEITFNGGSISHYWFENNLFKENTTYTIILNRKIETGAVNRIFIDSWETPIYANVNIECSDGLFIATFKTKSRNDSVQGGWKNNLIKFVRNGNSTGSFTIDDIVIIEGDHTANPPQHYFEGIKSLGEEENKISILSTGKNVFNIVECEKISDNSVVFNDDGTIQFTQGNKRLVLKNSGFKKNTQYALSLEKVGGKCEISIAYTDDSFDDLVGTTLVSRIGKTIKWIRSKWTDGSTSIINNIQLEEGTTVTPYQPHQADRKDILLPVSYGAKGFPSGTCDEILANGDCLQKIDRLVLSHSVFWGIYQDHADFISFFTSLENSKNKYFICDRFKFGSVYNNNSHEAIGIDSAQLRRVVINMKKTNLETPDVAGFKKWLQANPTTVYYELEIPILHKAEAPTNYNIATFKDITHISCLSKIAPSEISAKFPVEVSGTLSRLTSENKTLENENIKLKNEIIEQSMFFNDKDLLLTHNDLELDFRLLDLEIALDMPILFNSKGDVYMTQYEMMKTLILGGKYERIQMEIKIEKYLKYNKITQEQADELIALMDARDLLA